jgi:hypothetical protein
MNLDPYLSLPLQSTIISAVITGILGLIFRSFVPRSRVIWGVSHGFVFYVVREDKTSHFHTRTVFVQNVGRAPAESVEVHLNFKPEHFQIWPTFTYETALNPENRFTVSVKSLGKREFFSIELLAGGPLPDVLRVRSAIGEAKQVPMAPFQILPSWLRHFLQVLILLGVFAIIQNLFLLLH